MENNNIEEEKTPTTYSEQASNESRTVKLTLDNEEKFDNKNEERLSRSDNNLNLNNNNLNAVIDDNKSSNLEKSPSNSTLESDLNAALNDLKVSHLKEMTELRVCNKTLSFILIYINHSFWLENLSAINY